jgi:hypothetical protein
VLTMRLALSLLVLGGVAAAAAEVEGQYIEARTADVFTGPCYANSEINLTGDTAVFGWRIQKGRFGGVTLDGLSVVGVVKASATLGDVHTTAYPVKSVLLVDAKATPAQRIALRGFAQRMSGDLLQNIVREDVMPISIAFANNNVHSREATLQAGNLASIRTRALNNGDNHCSNEETWYAPLTKLTHSMPAFALDHAFRGEGLNTKWSSPEKRSAFVGEFALED